MDSKTANSENQVPIESSCHEKQAPEDGIYPCSTTYPVDMSADDIMSLGRGCEWLYIRDGCSIVQDGIAEGLLKFLKQNGASDENLDKVRKIYAAIERNIRKYKNNVEYCSIMHDEDFNRTTYDELFKQIEEFERSSKPEAADDGIPVKAP